MKILNELKDRLIQPSERLIEDMKNIQGDILILGVGGKMGPSLARLAMRALKCAGSNQRVIGVSRFSNLGLQQELEAEGVETIAADLLQEDDLQALPQAENVIYLAGNKFGTTGKEYFTWAMNAYLPGRVAEKYKDSKIVVFSSGNVYPMMPLISGGATEETSPSPIGEYSQSCLGRERVFEYFSHKYQIPMLIFRLSYANDLRYGVLVDIARSVKENKPLQINTGNASVIWQGDANEMALRSFLHCSVSATILNVTGPETASLRWIAEEFGKIFNVTPTFEGEEEPTAFILNAAEAFSLFGYPRVSLKEMIKLTAKWILEDGNILNKPTHFEEREGKY